MTLESSGQDLHGATCCATVHRGLLDPDHDRDFAPGFAGRGERRDSDAQRHVSGRQHPLECGGVGRHAGGNGRASARTLCVVAGTRPHAHARPVGLDFDSVKPGLRVKIGWCKGQQVIRLSFREHAGNIRFRSVGVHHRPPAGGVGKGGQVVAAIEHACECSSKRTVARGF
jgi:hypothetical protein